MPGTAVAAAIKALPRRRAWALTGTPLENCVVRHGLHTGFRRPRPLRAGRGWLPPCVGPCPWCNCVGAGQRCWSELPPKTVFELAPELLPVQRTAYNYSPSRGVGLVAFAGRGAAGHAYPRANPSAEAALQRVPASGESAKLEDIRRRLDV